jgi:2-oxo-4-hydroxy-4-carboxy-5-ureidoimidazoline decarboxylase
MDDGLARLNGLPPDEAREALRACCASAVWVDAMVAARPFTDRPSLRSFAEQRLRALDWADIREAVAAHPRIGERLTAAGRESAWSASEQSGLAAATAATRAALVEANRAYEERFGFVFLIFATGKTDEQLLAAARERVHHSEAQERDIVRRQLELIVALRLDKLLGEPQRGRA